MRRAEFEREVTRALDSLPPALAAQLENVAVIVEERDDEDPDLYGLYVGTPLTERGGELAGPPDVVVIYREPLVADFGHDAGLLRREIRATVLHELGHHFGFDERGLEDLGYE